MSEEKKIILNEEELTKVNGGSSGCFLGVCPKCHERKLKSTAYGFVCTNCGFSKITHR